MTGMLIYNNTTNQAMIATNAAWVAL